MTAPTLEELEVEFSEDPEINMLCKQRAEIQEFVSYNQLSDKAYDDLWEQLAEIEIKLQQLGYSEFDF